MNTIKLILTVLVLFNTLNLFSQAKTASVSCLFPGHDHPETVTAEIRDGFVIIEGDIIIGEEKNLHQKAATLTPGSRLWPNGTIPYVIATDHPGAQGILEAIQHVNESTNLCLVERSTESDYVEFINGSGCASSIGKTGGRQTIVASQYCGFGSFVHEILHAAGVYHEQSRADRDDHITIHWDEMNQRYRGNFNKYYTGQDVGPYDYNSLMHYHSYAFSSTGNPTISINPSAPEGTTIGQRNGLSSGDIIGINNIYPQSSSCGTTNLSCDDSGSVTDLDQILQWDGISVTNTGTQTTPPVMVDLYFSKNSVISTSDVYLGSVQIPVIEKGESHQFSEQLDKESIETLANQQNYYLGFIIDSNDELAESDENDNNDCANSSENIISQSLPVDLIAFHARMDASQMVELSWEVSEEYGLAYYQVQYSTDSKKWEDKTKVFSQRSAEGQYQVLDMPTKHNAGQATVYYRLKMVDKDGSERYSNIRSLQIKYEEIAELKVFPNPSNGAFQINLPSFSDAEFQILITNLNGQIVHQQAADQSTLSIDLQSLSMGSYWLSIITSQEVLTQKIVLTE